MALCRKIKEGKTRDQILYGKRIDLPILEDNPYFHDLLDPFDTKSHSFCRAIAFSCRKSGKARRKNKETQDIVELEKTTKPLLLLKKRKQLN